MGLGYYDRNGDRVTEEWKKSGDNWYWLNDDGEMAVDELIEDDDDYYYVDANGVWDGNASTVNNKVNLGPGVADGWEPIDTGWKFKQEDGTYLTNHGSRTQTASGTT